MRVNVMRPGMGQERSDLMGQFKQPVRKATFTVKTNTHGVREFKPANKRAQRYAKAITGKKYGKLNANDLRTIRANGTRVYQYTSDGGLVRIAV